MNRPGRVIARTVRGILLGIVLAAVPTATYALGLGGLQVKSALNEPLNGEIDFTSINKKELRNLSVTLASRRDFDAAGVERPPYLADVKFTLSKRLDGQPFLQLTSEQPIREPFLHFLVQVEWAGGRLVREFTALIDPPTLFAGAAPAVQVPEQAPLPITQPEAVPGPAPVITAAAPAETLAPAPEPTASVPALVEPPTAVAAAEPAVTTTIPAAASPPPTSSDEPLGPPRLGDSSVAISAETGWPLASTGPAALATGSDAPAVEPIVPAALASAAATMEPAAPVSMAAPMPVAGGWANVTRYDVKRGDTLWAIAQKVRVDPTLSLEQVIMALYEVNRDAFFKNNVNNVWAGEVLLIPKREEVETLSAGRARQVFLAQYGEWQEYKLKLASASRTFKVAAAPEQSAVPAESGAGTPQASAQPAAGAKPAEASAAPAGARKPEASKKPAQVDKPAKPEKTEPKPAAAPPTEQAATPPKGAEAPVVAVRPKPPADLLKIVRAAIDSEVEIKGKVAEAEGGDTSQKERLALADRATTLDEAMQSKQLEQKEIQERIGTHQSQIEKQERLIELSNKDAVKTKEALTQLEPQAAPPVEMQKGSEAEVAVKAPAEQVKPEDTAKAAPPPKAKPAAPADKTATPEAKKRRTAPPAPPSSAPAEEKGMFAKAQEMFGSYVMQAVAAVVALAGGLILLTYLRRRRAAEAEFEESILTDSDAMTDGGTTDSSGAQTTSSAASTSFLSDFSQGGMGNISTDEVDPLAETEVYLAYGRDEQAEEILKDAVAKDPKRHELKVKLLEIYAQRKDVPAFETLAEELYAAQAGRGGDLWNRVADMGRKLTPGNPMFQAVAPPDEPSLPMSIPSSRRPAASASDVLDFEPPTDRGGAGEAESAPSFDVDSEDLKAASSGLDFDFDLEGPESKAKSVADEPVIPDTAELSAEELHAGVSGQGDSLSLSEEPVESILDFDMGTEDRSGGEQEITADQTGEPSWDAGAGAEAGLALDTEADASVSTDDSQQWDETATKLDLAKAYVDMGDAEGARSILDEVLAEGNDEQKRQAAELAAQIA